MDIQSALSEYGEIILHMDSGQDFELHLHNTEFSDGEIFVEGPHKDYVIDKEKVEYYYYHYEV